ncbi:pyridoxal-dependent decarboxylase [Brasilonema sp. UFV-L1]|uniref:pyridoxal-dependent decarboxylase n=1 Tax=Brasilonema sp. UFV-L1 TaxID=2234130 RepID=UPI00145E4F55
MAATVGTTPSNAIDPIPQLGEIAQKYNIWLHVDAVPRLFMRQGERPFFTKNSKTKKIF